jgi:hypothetical protein
LKYATNDVLPWGFTAEQAFALFRARAPIPEHKLPDWLRDDKEWQCMLPWCTNRSVEPRWKSISKKDGHWCDRHQGLLAEIRESHRLDANMYRMGQIINRERIRRMSAAKRFMFRPRLKERVLEGEKNRASLVYRFYDREGVLLYVGVTYSDRRMARFAQHASVQPWWPRVDHSRTSWTEFATRLEADEAERETIKRHRPEYNVIHNLAA